MWKRHSVCASWANASAETELHRSPRLPSAGTRSAALPLAIATVLVILMVAVPPASAHAPLMTPGGSTLTAATSVEDPTKSQVLYDRLGVVPDVRYFVLDLAAGEGLRLQLLTPDRTAFAPSLAVMGPGISPQGKTPFLLKTPPGAGVAVIEGVRGEAEYEPFTPGAYFFTAAYDLRAPADGSYFVAVFSEAGGGPFGLAVGIREEFTAWEWLTLPMQLIAIYHWEGDGWLLILGPVLAVLLVGGVVLAARDRTRRRRHGSAYSLFQWLCFAAGLLAVGTGANLLAQMIQSALITGGTAAMSVTAAFAAIPTMMGALMIAGSARLSRPPSPLFRLGLVVFAAVCLMTLAGFIVGPVLALIAAALPTHPRTERNTLTLDPDPYDHAGRSAADNTAPKADAVV